MTPEYSVYLLRCSDESLYTGITTDVTRRMEEHQAGDRGAKYLRGKAPLQLVFQQPVGDRSTASKLEFRIKKLSRPDKEALIAGELGLDSLL